MHEVEEPIAPQLRPATRLVELVESASGSLIATDGTKLPWQQIFERATYTAGVLQASGLGPRSRIALIAQTSTEAVVTILAAWLTGAATAILPNYAPRQDSKSFALRTRALLGAMKADCIVTDSAHEWIRQPATAGASALALESISHSTSSQYARPATGDDDLAIVQFTSGSTDLSKPVTVSWRQLFSNVAGMAQRIDLDPQADRFVSWLPLYHDMGLVGCLALPLLTGTDLVLAKTEDFASRPGRWMEWTAHLRATLTAAPCSAYRLATRGLAASTVDVSRLRLAFCGAEQVSVDVVEAFLSAGAAGGLPRSSVSCVYGLAEATLAVTIPAPGSGLHVDTVDTDILEHERIASPARPGHRATRFAMLGDAIDGVELRIRRSGEPPGQPERLVGEIEIRGSNVASGYLPDETPSAIRGEWLATGDVGYITDSQLVVVGRKKDLIILGGRNISPEAVEAVAANVAGIRIGNVVAVGSDEGNRGGLAIIAECRSQATDRIRGEIRAAVEAELGVIASTIVLVEPHSIPRTSSGKLRRGATLAALNEGELPIVRIGPRGRPQP